MEKDLEENPSSLLRYGVKDRPPIPVTVMAALQHVLMSIASSLTITAIVADAACAPYDHPIRSTLFCTTLFMVGLSTILQTCLGIRLPVFQGPSSSFLVPLLALGRNPEWRCTDTDTKPLVKYSLGGIHNTSVRFNTTTVPSEHVGEVNDMESEIAWRLQAMSGSLMAAAALEVLLGAFGLLSVIIRFVGPITVACTISLIGVSLARLPLIYSRPSFLMGLGCCVLVLIFTLYCRAVTIPMPRIRKGAEGGKKKRFAIFELVPILVAVAIMWVLAWILTVCGVFPTSEDDPGYLARADAKVPIITSSKWFHLTHPGQFGLPRFNLALSFGFLSAFISSVVESVGDYYATQKACEAPRPPEHAISRGILVEGISSVISGSVGAGHATTSYSANIALLTLSGTASRSVMYTAGLILILTSLFSKFGAALTTIPNPILGGVFMVIIGTLLSIGLSSLKHVDLSQSRNLLVVGVPFMAGIAIPMAMDMYPGIVETGQSEVDQIVTVALGTPMFIGSVLALLLDNTVPGSLQSRGMAYDEYEDISNEPSHPKEGSNEDVYSWSVYPRVARFLPCITFLPFMPKLTDTDVSYLNINTDNTEAQETGDM